MVISRNWYEEQLRLVLLALYEKLRRRDRLQNMVMWGACGAGLKGKKQRTRHHKRVLLIYSFNIMPAELHSDLLRRILIVVWTRLSVLSGGWKNSINRGHMVLTTFSQGSFAGQRWLHWSTIQIMVIDIQSVLGGLQKSVKQGGLRIGPFWADPRHLEE